MSKAVDIEDVIIDIEEDFDKKAKNNSSESVKTFDDTVRRVITNAVEFKVHRRKELNKRKRLEVFYLVVAVLTMLGIALTLVGLRIAVTGLPEKSDRQRPTMPKYQWVMDWDPDFPESVVKERRIDMLWSSIYNLDYWLYYEDK
jgi:hypothetical protein